MGTLEKGYLAGWVSSLLVSGVLFARAPESYTFASRSYLRFLAEPWKFATFLLAMASIALAAPYSGDPTWDLGDSILVSATVYFFAPWSLATLARDLRARAFSPRLFVAFCAFWIPCWTYDLYMLLRSGTYPATWASNLGLSGPITFLGGLFWNLGWRAERGISFTFLWSEAWPPSEPTPFRKVLPMLLLLGSPVALAVAAFVYSNR